MTAPDELPTGMIPAEKIAAEARRREEAPVAEPATAADPEALARRDRLVEKLTVMQADLGGLFYEMAIRDSINMDVLLARAAELQQVDAELGQLDRAVRLADEGAAGACPNCGSLYARSSSFCATCGHALREVAAA